MEIVRRIVPWCNWRVMDELDDAPADDDDDDYDDDE